MFIQKPKCPRYTRHCSSTRPQATPRVERREAPVAARRPSAGHTTTSAATSSRCANWAKMWVLKFHQVVMYPAALKE